MIEYNEAINEIYDNNRINDKLRIVWMYNQFYNEVLKVVDDSQKEDFILIMERTLKLLAETMNSQRDTDLNMEKFMRLYFDLLKSSGYFSTTPTKELLENSLKTLNNSVLPYDDVRNYVVQFNKEEQRILMLGIMYSAFKSDEYGDKEIFEDLDISDSEYMKTAVSTVINLYKQHINTAENKEYQKKQ